jgi:hypothetical protein
MDEDAILSPVTDADLWRDAMNHLLWIHLGANDS